MDTWHNYYYYKSDLFTYSLCLSFIYKDTIATVTAYERKCMFHDMIIYAMYKSRAHLIISATHGTVNQQKIKITRVK